MEEVEKVLGVLDILLSRSEADPIDGDVDTLTKWVPEVINILSLRDFPLSLLPRVNIINQKVLELGVKHIGRDIAELQGALKYIFNPQENSFYKRANLLQHQAEKEGGAEVRLGLLQANVKYFRQVGGPRAILTRLFAKEPRKVTTATASLLLSPFIKIRAWVPGEEMASFLRTATDAVFNLLQVCSVWRRRSRKGCVCLRLELK